MKRTRSQKRKRRRQRKRWLYRPPTIEISELTPVAFAGFIALMEKTKWDRLPDGPEQTVYVGGKPMPVSEFIQTYPQPKHWLEDKP